MTRFNIALLTLLLPSVLAAPSRRSTIVPCKRNSTDVYASTGTGTGFPLSTGVPISILGSSLADASPDPSAAPVDSGSDDDCPATTTITSTNIVTETVIPASDPAQTQASGSAATGSAVLTVPAGPYGNATDSSSQYIPGPTGTAGSTGRSSRHGHKHKHKTTKSSTSTGTSVAEVPTSISTSASSSSSSSDADFSSSEIATSETTTSEARDVASAVQFTSTTASPTVDPGTSSDQALTPTTTSSYIAVPAPTVASSSTSESSSTSASSSIIASSSASASSLISESSSTSTSSSASASSPTSASSSTSVSSTSSAGGEFYQAPKSKTASSSTVTSSSASPSSPSSSPSSSSEQSSSAPSSSVQSSTMTVPSSTSTAASSTTSTGVSATVAATPDGGYSSNPGTGKRGLAYNAAALTTCFDKSSEVSWAYNWASSTSGLSNVFEYVPMLWGTQSEHTNNWQSAASAAIASGSKHLLSFNEPDLASQSNLSPAAAVAGHRTYLQPFAGRAKISAPAVTNGGLVWLEQFLVACSSCTIDFVPVHWYDSATNIAYFKAYITSAIAAAKGRPIWITEFGASGTQAQQVAFLQEVMPWLDGQAAVERYAYFGVFDGKLVSGTSLSALGQTFATYT